MTVGRALVTVALLGSFAIATACGGGSPTSPSGSGATGSRSGANGSSAGASQEVYWLSAFANNAGTTAGSVVLTSKLLLDPPAGTVTTATAIARLVDGAVVDLAGTVEDNAWAVSGGGLVVRFRAPGPSQTTVGSGTSGTTISATGVSMDSPFIRTGSAATPEFYCGTFGLGDRSVGAGRMFLARNGSQIVGVMADGQAALGFAGAYKTGGNATNGVEGTGTLPGGGTLGVAGFFLTNGNKVGSWVRPDASGSWTLGNCP